MNLRKSFLVVLITVCFSVSAFGKEFVVKPTDSACLEDQAASEFARYAGKVLGRKVEIVNAEPLPKLVKGNTYFIIGSHERNKLAKKLFDKGGLCILRRLPKHPDGFVICGEKTAQGAMVVLVAGRRPIGTLYAAYDYFERYCNCGFFEDGERIWKREDLPVADVEVITWPKFQERIQFVWDPRCLLKKSVSSLWLADSDWKRHWDFMAKNKMNFARIDVQWFRLGWGLFHKIYPEMTRPKDESAYYPAWWPAEFVFENTKKALTMARQRGIKLWYDAQGFAVMSDVKDIVKKYYPDVKFSKPDPAYPYITYIQDIKTIKAFYEHNLKETIKHYGKPDMYWASFPPDENEPFYEAESKFRPERFDILARIVHKYDPQARFLADGWLMRMRYGTPEKAGQYKMLLDKLKGNIVCNVSHDTYDENMKFMGKKGKSSPELFNYFWGHSWQHTFIEGFGGEDYFHLAVRYPDLLKMAKKNLTHPGSNCVGWGDVPELVGYDPLMRYVHMKLAWDPFVYDDWKEMVSQFVRRRYGAEAFNNMYASYLTFCEAMFDNRIHHDPYISSYKPVYRNNGYLAFPSVRDFWHLYTDGERTQRMKKALNLALSERNRFDGDDLYEKYISSLFHSYANEMFKLSMLRCYSAYAQATTALAAGKSGEIEELKRKFEKEAKRMDACLAAIEQVWGTRPELSTELEIKESMSVPGASKILIKTIRKDSACYEEGAFETLAQWYRPVAKLVVDDLRKRLAKGESRVFSSPATRDFTAFNWRDDRKKSWVEPRIMIDDPVLRPKIEAVLKDYVNGPVHVKRQFKGSTTKAVLDSLNKLKAVGCTLDEYDDMRTTKMIGENYPFRIRLRKISNGDFELGELGLWEHRCNGKGLARCDKGTVKDGKFALRVTSPGKASIHLRQKVYVEAIPDPTVAVDYCIKQMSSKPACLAVVINGYDSEGKKKLHSVYWAGMANWDHGTNTPKKNKAGYHTMKTKMDSTVGKWLRCEYNLAKDFDAAFGKGCYLKLGITEIEIELMIWTNEPNSPIDVYFDNVTFRRASKHVEKM